MKETRLLSAVFIALFLGSPILLAGTWEALPTPEYLDTEVCTDVALKAWQGKSQRIHYELTFDASVSNNVEIAFGVDHNADGILAIREKRLMIGWKCGSWFLRDAPVCEDVFAESVSGDRKTLSCTIILNEDGHPSSVTILDGDTPLFEEAMKPTIPAWMYSTEWNLMSLTARGVFSHNERFSFEMTDNGLIIFFR